MLEEGVGGGPPQKTVYPRFVFKNFTRRGNCGRKQLGGASGEGGGIEGSPRGSPRALGLTLPSKKFPLKFLSTIFSPKGKLRSQAARGCRMRGMRGGADREGVMEGEEGRALPKQFFPSKQFFEEILPKGLTVATGRHGMLEEGGWEAVA